MNSDKVKLDSELFPIKDMSEGAREVKYQHIFPVDSGGEDCKELLNKYLKGEKLTEEEKNRALKGTFHDLDLNNNLKIYRKLTSGDDPLSMSEVIFLIQNTAFLFFLHFLFDPNGDIKKNDIPKINIIYTDDKTCTGFLDPVSGEIFINYNLRIKPILESGNYLLRIYRIYELLSTVIHEMTHFRQRCEANNRAMTKSSYYYALNRLFYKYGLEHDSNYFYRAIEMEARQESQRYLIQLINDFNLYDFIAVGSAKRELKEEEETALGAIQSFPMQDKKLLMDDYYIEGLVKILKENPNEIDHYLAPFAKLFDRSTGEIVSEELLLKYYSEVTDKDSDEAQIYIAYLSYVYKKEEVIANTNLPAELLEVKTAFIAGELWKENVYKERFISFLKKNNLNKLKNKTKAIFPLRIEKIKKYVAFLRSVNYDENFISLCNEMANFYMTLEDEYSINKSKISEEEYNSEFNDKLEFKDEDNIDFNM